MYFVKHKSKQMNMHFYITFTFLICSLIVSGQPGPSDLEWANMRGNPKMTCISFTYKKDTIKWRDERFTVYCTGTSQIKETRTYMMPNERYGYDSLLPVYSEGEYEYQIFSVDSQLFCFKNSVYDSLGPIVIKRNSYKGSTTIFVAVTRNFNLLISNIVYDKKAHTIDLSNDNELNKIWGYGVIKQGRPFYLLNDFYDPRKMKKEEVIIPTAPTY